MTTRHDLLLGGRLRRLLVCFGGLPESMKAIELLLDLGKALGAQLTIFSVLAGAAHLESTEVQHAAEHTAREHLGAQLTGILRCAADSGVQFREVNVIGGDPGEEITRYATEHGFDLVVIGSHGQYRVAHGGLGRVVERLLRRSKCPVLVAPARADR
ncbi:MAG TPA: universal stress protein [Acidimicrobiales bacterium]|nr:universal stress protein [Acidimicrobiales bacterium]